jgi:hypothetical protein
MLVKEEFGVPDHVLQDSVARRNNVLLFILIRISLQVNRTGSWTSGKLSSLSNFDILSTLPELQHEFCTMWNEIGQDAGKKGSSSTPTRILRDIRHLYIALHQDTGAAPTAFSAPTDNLDYILEQPSSYPQCEIATHHRSGSIIHVRDATSGAVPLPAQSSDASLHNSTSGSITGTDRQLGQGINTITRHPWPPDPPTTSEIGETSQAPAAVHSSSHPSDRSSEGGVATAQANTISASAAKLSHPPESTSTRQRPTSGILPTVPAPAPAETSTTPVFNIEVRSSRS